MNSSLKCGMRIGECLKAEDWNHLERIQKEMAPNIIMQPIDREIRTIAGFDVQACTDDYGIAVLSLFSYTTKQLVDSVVVHRKFDVPYKSGFLAFRELPFIEEAWKKLVVKPECVAFDGHGIMHPRRMGLATHAGVQLGIPTFGIAKQPLLGVFEEPGNDKGDWNPIQHNGETVGAILRTVSDVKPVYVSVGHKMTLQQAIEISMMFANHRIPELTRYPDIMVRQECRQFQDHSYHS